MPSYISEEIDYQYTGQEYEDELDLHNFRVRFYDSDLMRFYAVDPAMEFASPYLYCGNNPILFTDPNGEHSSPNKLRFDEEYGSDDYLEDAKKESQVKAEEEIPLNNLIEEEVENTDISATKAEEITESKDNPIDINETPKDNLSKEAETILTTKEVIGAVSSIISGVGLKVTGISMIVGGGAVSTTGIGAVPGVPAMAGGFVLNGLGDGAIVFGVAKLFAIANRKKITNLGGDEISLVTNPTPVGVVGYLDNKFKMSDNAIKGADEFKTKFDEAVKPNGSIDKAMELMWK